MDQKRWSALCRRLGCPNPNPRLAELKKAYSEHHRHYHTAAHIHECLGLFDETADQAEHPDDVEFAIWLHDVVYAPRRGDNEERSASLAEKWLRTCQVEGETVDRVRRLILATQHADGPRSPDEALLQDIDLGILGASPERYDDYEQQVRREYRWVPGFIFRPRRRAILKSFLEREGIYRTPWFRERHESAARRNLTRAINKLLGGGAV